MRPPPRPASWWRAVLRSLEARNPTSARRWAAVALAATTVTCLGTGLAATGHLAWPELSVTAGLAVLAAALLLLPLRWAASLVVLAPLSGSAAVVWLDVISADAGLTGQVFFTVPVIWAASQLRVGGAALVTAGTLAGQVYVATSLLPRAEALTDVAYLGTLLLLVCAVLVRSGVVQDRLVEKLRLQAGVDPLTGLATRRVLDTATARAVAAPGGVVALVIIDLDHFKAVNDTHGHLGGDAALTHVARVLHEHCRESDVVARMGGDELAVLMPCCPPQVAVLRAQAFVDAVRANPLVLAGAVVPLSVSAGLASAPRDARDAEGLYARADAALYVAKRGGRDRLGLLPGAPA